MNSVWERLYDRFKDRLYGNLFVFTQAISLGLIILWVIICENGLQPYVLRALPGVALPVVVGFVLKSRRIRQQQRESFRFPPLSDSELHVARSKLSRQRQSS